MEFKTIDNVVLDLKEGRSRLEKTLNQLYPDKPLLVQSLLMQYDTTSGEYIKQYASDDKQFKELSQLYGGNNVKKD